MNMKRLDILIKRVICGCCVVAFLGACEQPPPPEPPKPKVVRKKIIFPPWVAAKLNRAVEEAAPVVAGGPSSPIPSTVSSTPAHETPNVTGTPEPLPRSETPTSSEPIAGGSAPMETAGTATQEIAPATGDETLIAYNAEGRLDPFIPLFREEPEEPKKEEKKEEKKTEKAKPAEPPRRLTPLEQMDLAQLKLVAIIRAETGNKALVEEASGKGYIITTGTYIGIHSGRVVEIQADKVVVEESVQDYVTGDMKTQTRELKFQRPAGDIL